MNNNKPMLLLLSDKPNNIDFFCSTLNEYCKIFVANDIESGMEYFSEYPDIALSIVDIDDFEDFLNEINKTYGKFIPVVVCVKEGRDKDVSKAYSSGAFEVIRAPYHQDIIKNRILKIVWHALGYEGYQDGAYKNHSLIFGATDILTQLHNRTYGEQVINDKISDKNFKDGIFIFVDINNFKVFNNRYGRQRGDRFLVDFAKKIKRHFIKEDAIICRLGGDEFAVFWETDSLSKKTNQKIKSLLDKLSTTIQYGLEPFNVGVCIGTVSVPKYGKTFGEICEKADKALYHSKSLGDNVISDYSEKMTFATRESEVYHINTLDYQNILDSFTEEAIVAISADEHKILYFNKKAQEVAPLMEVGKICNEVWEHNCETCPIKQVGEGEFIRVSRFDSQFKENVDITATRIMWHDHLPAFLVQICPSFKEQTAKRMPIINKLPEKRKNNGFENDNVGIMQYGENIFCLEGYATISDRQQSIINSLLSKNHGVGILSGYFDENLSISMISELALKVLFYNDFNEFRKNTNAYLSNLVKTKEERQLLRKKLLISDGEVWSYPFMGKNGKMISVRICNSIGVNDNGEKMWFLSLRRYTGHFHDSLTGGYNYEGFIRGVNNLRDRKADLRKYAIAYIDLKGFKALNELCGSEGADNLLIEMYRRFSSCKLEPVVLARKGSDHFLMLVKKELIDYKELKSLLNFYWEYAGKKFLLVCTCGIYNIEDNEQEVAVMVSNANLALESIQDEYVTPYALYHDLAKVDALSRVEILSKFDNALKTNQFQVYYQPIIDAKTKRVISAEALVRWVSNSNRIFSPATFIPVLEQSGYIVKLDKFVFENVRDFLFNRKENNLLVVPISINISKMDFFVEDEMNNMLGRLEKDEFLVKNMHFEITESSYVTLKEKQSQFIQTIKSLNGSVFLDDFGSGSASLDMLTMFDFDTLKIDMHFITEMVNNKKVSMLVENIIQMAHKLGLKVIAEGVETDEQSDLLTQYGCDYIQGYLYSKPLTQIDFERYLTEH